MPCGTQLCRSFSYNAIDQRHNGSRATAIPGLQELLWAGGGEVVRILPLTLVSVPNLGGRTGVVFGPEMLSAVITWCQMLKESDEGCF